MDWTRRHGRKHARDRTDSASRCTLGSVSDCPKSLAIFPGSRRRLILGNSRKVFFTAFADGVWRHLPIKHAPQPNGWIARRMQKGDAWSPGSIFDLAN